MPGGKSGVYLVSASRHDGSTMDSPGFDNHAYEEPTRYKEDVHPKVYSEKPYRGMGKEELLYHSSKPFWRNLRYFCGALVLLVWLGLIATTIALIVVYPKCRDPPSRSWWQESAIYRVYTRSFLDTDNDGIGDIKGVIEKMDYMKELGVKIISISSVYETGTMDNDFDIKSHVKIAAEYGTMTDMENLINATHEAGMYLIMDFIPNHTSDKHPWFINSQNYQTDSNAAYYKNFYVWNEGNPPNNWVNKYGGSAWTWDSTRNESYLHQFLSTQPDLNVRSSLVQEELKGILDFWMNKGVDGFYVRRSAYLFEDYDLRAEVEATDPTSTDPDSYGYYDHAFTYAQKEVYDILARWRFYLDDFGNENNKELLMFADINGNGDLQSVLNYYSYFGAKCTNFPVNIEFLDIDSTCNGECISKRIQRWKGGAPVGSWPNWLAGLEDTSRIGSRGDDMFTRAFEMMSILLPGTPLLYAGDEIGIKDVSVTAPASSRSQPWRSPMLWHNNGTLGGFCDSCNPWIHLNDNIETISVETQTQKNNSGSLLNFMTSLLKLRQEASFQYGEFIRTDDHADVLSFVREWDGEDGYLVAINFGADTITKDFTTKHSTIPSSASVALATSSEYYSEGDGADVTSLKLGPLHGVAVKWEFVPKDL